MISYPPSVSFTYSYSPHAIYFDHIGDVKPQCGVRTNGSQSLFCGGLHRPNHGRDGAQMHRRQRFIPCQSDHIFAYPTTPHHFSPRPTLRYPTTAHHTRPHHIIPHHTTPHHTIPHHTHPLDNDECLQALTDTCIPTFLMCLHVSNFKK